MGWGDDTQGLPGGHTEPYRDVITGAGTGGAAAAVHGALHSGAVQPCVKRGNFTRRATVGQHPPQAPRGMDSNSTMTRSQVSPAGVWGRAVGQEVFWAPYSPRTKHACATGHFSLTMTRDRATPHDLWAQKPPPPKYHSSLTWQEGGRPTLTRHLGPWPAFPEGRILPLSDTDSTPSLPEVCCPASTGGGRFPSSWCSPHPKLPHA